MRCVKRLAFGLLLVTVFVASACDSETAPSASGAEDIPALQMIDRTVGSGATATAGRPVTVHYTGWLYSSTASQNKGRQFDSSRDRNQPYTFTLGTGQVIAGWDQGVAGMRVGGTRTLLIPSSLGYGPNGYQTIPPKSALVFDVELLSVQ
jgi:FKBP-type peptidyl-prolyl cis-trans isomerase FkpA